MRNSRWSSCSKSERDNLGDMGIGSKDLYLNSKRLTKESHGLQTLLIIGSATSDEDLDFMCLYFLLVLLEGANDALESRRNIREIGNTTADDENLAIRARSATCDQVD